MTTLWRALIGLIAIGAVLSLVTLFNGSRPVGAENLVGRPLPGFAAPLAEGSVDGDANIYTAEQAKVARSVAACDVRLKGVFNSCRDLEGDAILTFWNTTRGECARQVAVVDGVVRSEKNVTAAAVAFDQESSVVRDFVAGRNWKIAVPIDRDGAVAALYAVAGCPTTFFIHDGTVEAVELGTLSPAELERGLRDSRNGR